MPPAGSVVGLAIVGAVLAVDVRLDRERSGRGTRLRRDHVALVATTALLAPLVRVGGVTVEGFLPAVSPYVVGTPFSLLLGLGLIAAGGTRWAGDALARHRYRVSAPSCGWAPS